mmetsp:Transcript_6153/g.10679  ORF Transcript_6153/g.10679 Transcript_6153/m.10679 type:complete len:439 (-) Transcript_6153:185-1501(-)
MAEGSATLATAAYNQFTKAQQEEFGQIVIEKLRGSVGVHGELSVLAEYIQVMLQSSRPPDQIEGELTAFLTHESAPFTKWLFQRILDFVDQAGGKRKISADGTVKKKVKRRNREKVGEEDGWRPALRSRSRRRRRSDAGNGEGGAVRVLREALPSRDGPEPGYRSEPSKENRKAVLTPNVQYLREAYHNKNDPVDAEEEEEEEEKSPPPGSKWHFRADEPPPPHAYGAPPPYPYGGMPPGQPPPGYPAPAGWYPPPHAPTPGAPASHPAAGTAATPAAPPVVENAPGPKPKHFTPKKWRVVHDDTVVRLSMHLDSEQVCFLRKGEIVEQIAPQYTLTNGIVRLQIRHPSSPSFPNPIGWVTLDASPAGGPKFLEAGPEPMGKGFQPRAPHSTGPPPPASPWRPPGMPHHARPFRPRGAPPAAARGVNGAFQNLTWKAA